MANLFSSIIGAVTAALGAAGSMAYNTAGPAEDAMANAADQSQSLLDNKKFNSALEEAHKAQLAQEAARKALEKAQDKLHVAQKTATALQVKPEASAVDPNAVPSPKELAALKKDAEEKIAACEDVTEELQAARNQLKESPQEMTPKEIERLEQEAQEHTATAEAARKKFHAAKEWVEARQELETTGRAYQEAANTFRTRFETANQIAKDGGLMDPLSGRPGLREGTTDLEGVKRQISEIDDRADQMLAGRWGQIAQGTRTFQQIGNAVGSVPDSDEAQAKMDQQTANRIEQAEAQRRQTLFAQMEADRKIRLG